MQTLRELLALPNSFEHRSKLLDLLAQGCEGLSRLHAEGKVHGGLEPSRFVCSVEERVQLAPPDAGGAPTAYLSPEHIREEPLDARADLYSLGVVLYEILTGRLPFEETAYPALVLAVLTRPPTPPKNFWPDCPAPLNELCLSLLSKAREQRPKNLQEVLPTLTARLSAEHTSLSDGERAEDSRPKTTKLTPTTGHGDATYELKEEIGRGGAGRILRATDRRIGREIALKESLSATPLALERFVREALLTARLEHPAIVPIHETGHWPDGSPFYTMKLIDGRPLSEVMEGLPFQERLALLPRVFTAAEAISYAHAKGVIHRDLKPQNILVGGYGETVVIDWGLAKDLHGELSAGLDEATSRWESALSGRRSEALTTPSKEDERLTRVGTILGTPAYMPPEQAEGREVNEQADVYALGAILYHLLGGVPPYDTVALTSELLEVIRREPPRPLQEVQPETPKDLCALVSKAMSRDPRERYPSAAELCIDLDHFLRGGLVSAHRYSLGEIVRRGLKRYRAAVTVALFSLLALSFLGAYSLRQILAAKTTAEENANLATHNEGLANHERSVAIDRLEQLALNQARALVERSPWKALGALKLLSPGSPRWRAARLRAADIEQRGLPQVLNGLDGSIAYACVVGGTHLIATAEANNVVRLWDTQTLEARVISNSPSSVTPGVNSCLTMP